MALPSLVADSMTRRLALAKKLKNEFAASGDWPYDEHSPFPVYPTTLPHTAENNKYFASKFRPNDCLLPDTPIIVARVAAQLKPNSLLVRVTQTVVNGPCQIVMRCSQSILLAEGRFGKKS